MEKELFTIGERLLAYAKDAGADAADMVLIESSDVAVSYRHSQPEDIERAESTAAGLRVFVGQNTATISTTDFTPDMLEECAQRAVSMASASVPDVHASLAPDELLAKDIKALDLYDETDISVEWLQEQCAQAESAALEEKGITNSEGAEAHASKNRITLMTSAGFAQSYHTSSSSISLSVIAGQGDKMERDYAYTMARHHQDLEAAASVGEEAAKRTMARLNPQKVSTKKVPVIFDPRVGRSLLGNFASAINGSSVARGTSFLRDKMQEQIFTKNVTIVDDPHRPRGLGSKPFDAEGVKNSQKMMVQDGVLQSWFLDMHSANKLGLQTTGHAVRGVAGSPHPSCSNLYIENGSVSPEDLIADVKDGFYVTNVFGMGVNLITGDYSQGASGVWIENGELTCAVSELTIAGHLNDMFAQMTPANDLTFRYGTNVPTLYIANMMVAGV